jgi:hypothetical protein
VGATVGFIALAGLFIVIFLLRRSKESDEHDADDSCDDVTIPSDDGTVDEPFDPVEWENPLDLTDPITEEIEMIGNPSEEGSFQELDSMDPFEWENPLDTTGSMTDAVDMADDPDDVEESL